MDLLSFPSEVYHGTISSNLKSLKKGINISKSNDKTDFGKGFYTTFNYEQALNFAHNKAFSYNNFNF